MSVFNVHIYKILIIWLCGSLVVFSRADSEVGIRAKVKISNMLAISCTISHIICQLAYSDVKTTKNALIKFGNSKLISSLWLLFTQNLM